MYIHIHIQIPKWGAQNSLPEFTVINLVCSTGTGCRNPDYIFTLKGHPSKIFSVF